MKPNMNYSHNKKLWCSALIALLAGGLCSCQNYPGPTFRFEYDHMSESTEDFDIRFAFDKKPVRYTRQYTDIKLGDLVVTNKSRYELRLYNYRGYCGLMKSSRDEIVTSVQPHVRDYEVVERYSVILDSTWRRLEFSPETVTKISINLDVRYLTEQFIEMAVGEEDQLTIEIYPCHFLPGPRTPLRRDALPSRNLLGIVTLDLTHIKP